MISTIDRLARSLISPRPRAALSGIVPPIAWDEVPAYPLQPTDFGLVALAGGFINPVGPLSAIELLDALAIVRWQPVR